MSVATSAVSFPFLPSKDQIKASKATAPTVKPAPKKNATKEKTPKVATVKSKATKEKTPAKVVANSKANPLKGVKVAAYVKPSKATDTVKPRKGFELTIEDIEQYRAEWKDTKVMPIPHNRGNYRSLVQALITLGKDKPHTFKSVRAEIVKIMSDAETKDEEGKTAWQRFNGKESDSENGLKTDARIHQNAEVLQRLGGETPYGLRLMQIGTKVLKSKGCCIDILKGKDGKEKLYRLNTNSAAPVNEFRRQRSK